MNLGQPPPQKIQVNPSPMKIRPTLQLKIKTNPWN